MNRPILFLTLTLATLSSWAYDFTYTHNGKTLYFNIITNATNEVAVTSGSSKYSGDIEIPKTVSYDGTTYTVTSIGGGAFYTCNNLTSIIVPETVESIGGNAFCECSSLTTASLPEGLTSIGTQAFYKCTSLTSISIPESVTSIGVEAFRYCENLSSVYFHEAMELDQINSGVFENCYSLTAVAIPDGVVTIGTYAFQNCTNLTSVVIPASVKYIAYNAFKSCSSLTSIDLPNSVINIQNNVFEQCGLKTVTIPESVTSVGEAAFKNCSNLTTFNYNAAVINNYNFGDYVFDGCVNLTTINIGSTVTKLPLGAFKTCTAVTLLRSFAVTPPPCGKQALTEIDKSNCTLLVPEGSLDAYKAADQWKDFIHIDTFDPQEALTSYDITDGEIYTNTHDYYDIDVTYTRNFKNTSWQALYLPFDMSYDEWSAYVDIAEIHNVRGYDYDNDNVLDEIVIEFNKLGEGDELVPNVPYVVRAKKKGEVKFECTGKTLLAAPTTDTPIECSSTKMTYSFHGVYEPKTGLYEQGAYRLTGGAFCQYATSAGTLDPYRFYLLCIPKVGGYNKYTMPQQIKIHVIGDDDEDTDALDFLEIDPADTPADATYYDLLGRPVTNPSPGIYIQNGHKVLIK